MGVRISNGTIVVGISDMVLEDAGDYDQAVDELSSAVRGAISGACETYRNGLDLQSVDLEDWEVTQQVARVLLSAQVEVLVRYDPSEGTQPDDWASDEGWNYLAFEAQNADFDFSVRDHNTGDDASEADWDVEDEVQNPADHQRANADRLSADLSRRARLHATIQRIGHSNQADMVRSMQLVMAGLNWGLCGGLHRGDRVATGNDGLCDSCREGARQQAVARTAAA